MADKPVSLRILWAGRLVVAVLLFWFCALYYDIFTGLNEERVCDPFHQRGMLHVDTNSLQNNRWMPFNEDCPSSNMLIPTLRASWNIKAPSVALARKSFAGSDKRDEAQAPFETDKLQGKTVLLFGDSLSRGNVFQFCELFGERPIVIREGHPYWPGEAGQDYPVINTTTTFPRITPPTNPYDPADPEHDSHYCYIPALDLFVLQVFNFGMDQDFYWKSREKSTPYLYEYRMSWLAKSTLQRTGRGEPDLVLMGSALWDSAKWMREDLQTEIDPNDGLSTERVQWYRKRVDEVVIAARGEYPRSEIMWMANHYPAREFSSWFVGDVKGKKRPSNKINRLAQMNAAARSVIEHKHAGDVGMFLWGELMLGQESHQIDDLHTTLMPGGVLFAEMLLYYLYQH